MTELLRAFLVQHVHLEQECDDWKLAFEALNAHVGKLQASQAALLAALKDIEKLASGWDEDGALGPRAPLSWESVARVAMDLARFAIAAHAEAQGAKT